MKPVPVLALLLVAAVAAGCTSIPFLGGGDGLTAKDAAARALPRAQQWHADAALVGLAGAEARNETFGGEGPFPFSADLTPGDGRAPAWMLHYYSPSANRSLAVAVYANNTVLVDEDEDRTTGPGAEELLDPARWLVDSPQAMAVALQDANFSRAAHAPDGGAMLALAPHGGAGNASGGDPSKDPMWILVAGSEAEGDGAFLFINARTGESFPFGFGFGDFRFDWGGSGSGEGMGPAPSVHTFQGSLGPTARSASQPFEVLRGQTMVDAVVNFTRTAPTDNLGLRLLDHHGNEVAAEASGFEATADGGTATGDWTVDDHGTYTLVLELVSSPAGPVGAPVGVGVDYEGVVTVF